MVFAPDYSRQLNPWNGLTFSHEKRARRQNGLVAGGVGADRGKLLQRAGGNQHDAGHDTGCGTGHNTGSS